MNVLRLIPEQGRDTIVIEQDLVSVGRDPASDVHLRDASVSRRHAEIQKGGHGEWVIADLHSGNGILVDGVRTSRSVLQPGQRLHIGNVGFHVEIDRGDEGSTVILKRSPFAARDDATMLVDPPPDHRPLGPRPSEGRTPLLIAVVAVAGLAAASAGLLALYRPRPPAPRPPAPVPTPLAAAAAAPTPSRVPPTEAPVQTPAAPRSALLITADAPAEVLIDGQRRGAIEADRPQRMSVVPGDHIVTLVAADGRHEQVAHVSPFEQSVVRFSGGAAMTTPTPAALRMATISPIPSPSAEPMTPRPSSPTPVPPPPAPVIAPERADPDLQNGAAATRRGDFLRALLVLKDVVKRLEGDPKARRELGLAHAYLAWTYQGLARTEEARLAAEKAVQAYPDVLAGLENPPDEVASLFKRRR